LKPATVTQLVLTVCLVFTALPAMAGSYDNGPPLGDSDGTPTINFGFIVSNTFIFLQTQQVNSFEFSAWLLPGDQGAITSAELSITSQENGGTVYFDQTLTGWFLGSEGCILNEFGYYNCDEKVNFTGPVVTGGITYWVNLQNASVPSNDPIYWDQNFGVGCGGDNGSGGGCPSLASESTVGTILSEAFTIYGTPVGTVPEPNSLWLLGSGIVGIVAVLRRKLL
jgi:hypothetical protein